jgi:hypothetical protein
MVWSFIGDLMLRDLGEAIGNNDTTQTVYLSGSTTEVTAGFLIATY